MNQTMMLQRCRSNAEPLKAMRNSIKEESSLIKPMKIQSDATVEHEADDISEELSEMPKSAAQKTESVASLFKERMVTFRKSLSKKLVFADQLDLRDTQMVSEFAFDIY